MEAACRRRCGDLPTAILLRHEPDVVVVEHSTTAQPCGLQVREAAPYTAVQQPSQAAAIIDSREGFEDGRYGVAARPPSRLQLPPR